MNIPFSFLPEPIVMWLSKEAVGIGEFIASLRPGLKLELIQAEINIPARRYAAISFVVGVSNFIILFLLIWGIGLLAKSDLLLVALGIAAAIGFASFISVLFSPSILIKRKTRALDNNLIPAIRQLLINLRSGVPLFNAMTSVSTGYGEVSVEFKRMVNQLNAGVPETDVLNEASMRNPSFRFRRVLWQISNALKVGSDVGNAIEEMIEELTRERIGDIQRYGQELNPWIMIYMVLAIVLPSIGVTILIIIMSFFNIFIPKMVFPGIISALVLFQLFFISFVKSRRPAVD